LIDNLLFSTKGSSTSLTSTPNNNQNPNMSNTYNNDKKDQTIDYNLENSNENKRQLLHWYRIIWNKLANNSAEDIARFAIIALLKDKMDLNSAFVSIIEGTVKICFYFPKQ